MPTPTTLQLPPIELPPMPITTPPLRQGALGPCHVCGDPAASHFDSAGQWLGCSKAPEGFLFVLVGVPMISQGKMRARDDEPAATRRAATKPAGRAKKAPPARMWGAVYVSMVPKGGDLKALANGGGRYHDVLKIIHAGNGLRTGEIREKAGLDNGQIQQVLRWLRDHKLVDVREAVTKA